MSAEDMRVLCLLPSIPLGGMERAVIRVVEQLNKTGAECHFIAEQRWGRAVQKEIEKIGASWTGVPFVAALGRPKSWTGLKWSVRSWLCSAADFRQVFAAFQPKQLLVTNINNAYFARAMARDCNIRSVFRLPNPPSRSRWWIKRKIDRKIWRMVYESYDQFVCNAQYTAEKLAEFVGDDRKIVVVRNFPPKHSCSQLDGEFSLDKRRRTIVYLGQISKEKGVAILIEAAAKLIAEHKDVDLVLAGPDIWQSHFGNEVRHRVQLLGLERRIRFLGWVDDVGSLLARGFVHVCPSISEGESFPNVVIEAKQAGLPSVVFPTAGLPEAITNGVDGIITSAPTASALETALSRLLDDAEFREQLAVGARASLQAYSDDQITRRWLDIFNIETSCGKHSK